MNSGVPCDWYNIAGRWIRKYPWFGLIEIIHKKKLQTTNMFVLAQQAYQVYYSSFPSSNTRRRDLRALCKIKARSRINLPLIDKKEEDDTIRIKRAFQEEETIDSHSDAFTTFVDRVDVLVDHNGAPIEVDLEEIRYVQHNFVLDEKEDEEAKEGFENFDIDNGEQIDAENNDILSDDNVNCDD
ncbi:hypothetical protein CDL12_30140 [Handroanthus impetiginosus]|uniref:DUF4216 domain-containing protein n=1 Tax=Handroanthus impetiginosus TaxID=429701 RepID=A0A2G9FWF3_9LAMI|nr:hypothetical protein CDL12_30140 [Handroanthus impetiginosus]